MPLLLTSHSSLLLRLTRPPVRPPQLRCTLFPSMHLPHLLVLPTTFWTSVPFATLSAFPSLICGSCSSGQRFAYSFFQIPPHDGHPCCSAMYFVVVYAHSGLSPVRERPCRANKTGRPFLICRHMLQPIYADTLLRISSFTFTFPGNNIFFSSSLPAFLTSSSR